jgi:type IV secretory pathway VirB9-like protein
MRPTLATFALLTLAASQMALGATAPKPAPSDTQAPAAVTTVGARTVEYHAQDIVPIRAKMQYTTLIAVPPSEKIMEAAVGDKDYWIVDVVGSFCFVHPAKKGISSNLNLITDKGNIYSFTLAEVSGTGEQPDLKVMVEPADHSSLVASSGPAQYVPAAQIDQVRKQLAEVENHIGAAVDEYKAAYPLSLRFDYEYKQNKDPFDIQSIYHDDRFTYIKTTAPEKFAVYDIKDGKPNLINYQLRNGTYIIPTVLEDGYVQLGAQKMKFKQKKG